VTWSEHAKVAAIQRRELALPKSLGDGKHRGVDQANNGVGLLIA
jgi:hypothetical protein